MLLGPRLLASRWQRSSRFRYWSDHYPLAPFLRYSCSAWQGTFLEPTPWLLRTKLSVKRTARLFGHSYLRSVASLSPRFMAFLTCSGIGPNMAGLSAEYSS